MTRTRNPKGEGARLRQDILEAATALLDETGQEQAVTLRAVARRVGVTAPSIYGHFPDREAILLAVVDDAYTALIAQLTAADRTDPDPVGRLRAVCAAYLDFAGSHPQRYGVMFGGLWSVAEQATIASYAVDRGREALGVLVAALTDCVAAGRSASTDPAADAVALWAGLHGVGHLRSTARSFRWPADLVDRVVDPLAHLLP